MSPAIAPTLVESSPPCCDDEALRALLQEDLLFGELTTAALELGARPTEVSFRARAPMLVCGTEEAARIFQLCGVVTHSVVASGASVGPDDVLLAAHGDAFQVLTACKAAQALTEALSGIATAAGHIVQALREAGLDVPVACTRRHFPGTRVLAAKAVRAGGAVMHSHGLSTLLIRPEHRAFIEQPRQAAAIQRLKSRQPEMLVVAQVDSFDDALALAHAGADVLQLEQFEPAQLQALRTTLSTRGLQPLIAPAAGVNLSNAVDYARAGADFLVTSFPYFAAPADIRVELRALPNAPHARVTPRASVPAG